MKIYVNVNAARGGNGSKESPFKAINDAAKIENNFLMICCFMGV